MIDAERSNALLAEWLDRQTRAFAALTASPGLDQSAIPEALERSYREFWSTLSATVPSGAATMEGMAGMFSALAAAGTAGPTVGATSPFDALWKGSQRGRKMHDAWVELQQASSAHHALLDTTWRDISSRFLNDLARPSGEDAPPIATWREGLDLWLEITNDQMLKAQDRELFLASQQRMLQAVTDYRLSAQAFAEEMCELLQIPTRREVDELARTVHELRREVRRLERARADAAAGPSPTAQSR